MGIRGGVVKKSSLLIRDTTERCFMKLTFFSTEGSILGGVLVGLLKGFVLCFTTANPVTRGSPCAFLSFFSRGLPTDL